MDDLMKRLREWDIRMQTEVLKVDPNKIRFQSEPNMIKNEASQFIEKYIKNVVQRKDQWLKECVKLYCGDKLTDEEIKAEIKENWTLASLNNNPMVEYLLYRGKPVAVSDTNTKTHSDGSVMAFTAFNHIPHDYRKMLPDKIRLNEHVVWEDE